MSAHTHNQEDIKVDPASTSSLLHVNTNDESDHDDDLNSDADGGFHGKLNLESITPTAVLRKNNSQNNGDNDDEVPTTTPSGSKKGSRSNSSDLQFIKNKLNTSHKLKGSDLDTDHENGNDNSIDKGRKTTDKATTDEAAIERTKKLQGQLLGLARSSSLSQLYSLEETKEMLKDPYTLHRFHPSISASTPVLCFWVGCMVVSSFLLAWVMGVLMSAYGAATRDVSDCVAFHCITLMIVMETLAYFKQFNSFHLPVSQNMMLAFVMVISYTMTLRLWIGLPLTSHNVKHDLDVTERFTGERPRDLVFDLALIICLPVLMCIQRYVFKKSFTKMGIIGICAIILGMLIVTFFRVYPFYIANDEEQQEYGEQIPSDITLIHGSNSSAYIDSSAINIISMTLFILCVSQGQSWIQSKQYEYNVSVFQVLQSISGPMSLLSIALTLVQHLVTYDEEHGYGSFLFAIGGGHSEEDAAAVEDGADHTHPAVLYFIFIGSCFISVCFQYSVFMVIRLMNPMTYQVLDRTIVGLFTFILPLVEGQGTGKVISNKEVQSEKHVSLIFQSLGLAFILAGSATYGYGFMSIRRKSLELISHIGEIPRRVLEKALQSSHAFHLKGKGGAAMEHLSLGKMKAARYQGRRSSVSVSQATPFQSMNRKNIDTELDDSTISAVSTPTNRSMIESETKNSTFRSKALGNITDRYAGMATLADSDGDDHGVDGADGFFSDDREKLLMNEDLRHLGDSNDLYNHQSLGIDDIETKITISDDGDNDDDDDDNDDLIKKSIRDNINYTFNINTKIGQHSKKKNKNKNKNKNKKKRKTKTKTSKSDKPNSAIKSANDMHLNSESEISDADLLMQLDIEE